MSTQLWVTIEPDTSETRVLLSVPHEGTRLKARLPSLPAHPRAVTMLLESLSLWYRRPLTAVFDADALGMSQHAAQTWCEGLGDPPSLDVTVEWVQRKRAGRSRDRFFEALGRMGSAEALLTRAATGQR